MSDQDRNLIASDSRYRALLGVSTLLAAHSDVHAIVHSVSLLLSKIVGFDSVALLLVNEDGQTARLYALESEERSSDIQIGHDFSFKDTSLALVLKNQKPMYIPSLKDELAKLPGLSQPAARLKPTTSAYMFPVSSARRQM